MKRRRQVLTCGFGYVASTHVVNLTVAIMDAVVLVEGPICGAIKQR
jgi:hypothetical protein